MSVRSAGAAQGQTSPRIEVSQCPTSGNDATVMWWMNLATDRNNFSSFCWFGDGNAVAPHNAVYVGTAGDGTEIQVWHGGSRRDTGTLQLTVGTWYHITWIGRLSASASWTLYTYNFLDHSVTTKTGTLDTETITSDIVWFNNDPLGEPAITDVACVKIWDGVQLSENEVIVERWSAMPLLRLDALWCYVPFPNVNDLFDYGYKGRNFTAQGTHTTESPAPLSYHTYLYPSWLRRVGMVEIEVPSAGPPVGSIMLTGMGR